MRFHCFSPYGPLLGAWHADRRDNCTCLLLLVGGGGVGGDDVLRLRYIVMRLLGPRQEVVDCN